MQGIEAVLIDVECDIFVITDRLVHATCTQSIDSEIQACPITRSAQGEHLLVDDVIDVGLAIQHIEKILYCCGRHTIE